MIKTIPIVLRGYTVHSWMSVSLPCIKEINKLTWNDSFKSFNYRRAKVCYSCVRLYVTSTQIGHTASNRSVDIPQQITVNKEYHPNITLGSTCEPALETPTTNAKSHLPPVSFMDLSIKPTFKTKSMKNPETCTQSPNTAGSTCTRGQRNYARYGQDNSKMRTTSRKPRWPTKHHH